MTITIRIGNNYREDWEISPNHLTKLTNLLKRCRLVDQATERLVIEVKKRKAKNHAKQSDHHQSRPRGGKRD